MSLASLDIEVTRRCNLRCEYCFVGWSRGWTAEMPADIAHQIVAEGSGLFPVLHVTGGEPFTYPALFDVVEAGLGLEYDEILINTNGTLLTAPVVQRLDSYRPRLHLSVSLDGPQEIHDAVRGAGRFEKAATGIERLLDAGVRVTVMTVVTERVLQCLPAFVRDLYDRHPGIVGVTLYPVGVGPPGTQKPGVELQSLTPDQIQELALAVALLFAGGYNVGVGAYPIINPLLTALGYPPSRLYECTAGRGRICVHADLTVSTCHPVKEPVYGRWEPGLLSRVGEHRAHERMAKRDFDGCRTCSQQEVCGNCRAFVTAAGAPLYGNDGICNEILPSIVGPL
jgi:radical SAM protein with 4Fe4S-binding SPASM domain